AGVGARRLDPGADRQPAAGPAAPLRPQLPVHRPRPRRGEAHQRSGRGDVSRQAGRDRRQEDALRPPAAPLHPGAAVGDPAARPANSPSASPPSKRPRRRSHAKETSQIPTPGLPRTPSPKVLEYRVLRAVSRQPIDLKRFFYNKALRGISVPRDLSSRTS